jgi:hypothetical protein
MNQKIRNAEKDDTNDTRLTEMEKKIVSEAVEMDNTYRCRVG